MKRQQRSKGADAKWKRRAKQYASVVNDNLGELDWGDEFVD